MPFNLYKSKGENGEHDLDLAEWLGEGESIEDMHKLVRSNNSRAKLQEPEITRGINSYMVAQSRTHVYWMVRESVYNRKGDNEQS